MNLSLEQLRKRGDVIKRQAEAKAREKARRDEEAAVAKRDREIAASIRRQHAEKREREAVAEAHLRRQRSKTARRPLASDGCVVTKPYREHFPNPFRSARQVSAQLMDRTIRVDKSFIEWAESQPSLKEVSLRIVMRRGALVHRAMPVSELSKVLKEMAVKAKAA